MAFEGLYKVEFRTPQSNGTGVVVLKGGVVQGGDAGMYYTGTYSEDGNSFGAHLTVRRHTQGNASVFGIDNFTLHLNGQGDGNTAVLRGSSPEAQGFSFDARLERLFKA